MYNEYHLATDNKKQLFIREWLPGKSPQVIVLYIHGLGSHSGRIGHWADRFARAGLGFIAYDQQGHGKTGGKRGYPKNISYLIRDARAMLHMLREKYPDSKIVVYGHSLGGNVAINYVISETVTADALIVTSPWLKLVNPPSKSLLTLVRFLNRILPGLTLSNRLNPEHISRDPQIVEAYEEDELVHDRISVGLFKTAYESGFLALRNVYKINCPFLIMHGNADRITSCRASENYVMNTSERTRLVTWEGAYHELHHEPEREEVFETIISWLKETGLIS